MRPLLLACFAVLLLSSTAMPQTPPPVVFDPLKPLPSGAVVGADGPVMPAGPANAPNTVTIPPIDAEVV